MTWRQINYFNLFSLILLLCLWRLPNVASPANNVLMLLAALFILVVPGTNIVYAIEKLGRFHFDLPVFISLTLLSSLIIPPTLIVLVYSRVNFIDAPLILSVYAAFLLLPAISRLTFYLLRRIVTFPPERLLVFPLFSLLSLLSHPLFIAGTILSFTLLLNLTRFSFLPVPDSYSWLINFNASFSDHRLPITADFTRSSFAAFIAVFYFLSAPDLWSIFKYLFPFLSLLIFAPLWTAAHLLPSRRWQLLFLLSAIFISPAVILELTYIRQQVVFLFFLYFLVGLSIYAIGRQAPSMFYLLFIISLFGITFHPAFLIIVLTFFLTWLLAHWSLIRRHPVLALLLFFIFFPLAKKAAVINMFVRIYEQASASFLHFFIGNWNLKFPAYYVSSDAYEMSWPGISGVIKYYAYYMGPAAAIILLAIGIWLASRRYRQPTRHLFRHPAFLAVLLPFILFFAIAEIAPRFGNIAFLPDRAWQYLSILCIFPLFYLFQYVSSLNRPLLRFSLPAFFLFSSALSVFGASYVNNLNRYTIPDYEFKAAAWIRTNLDPASAIYSSSSKNIIRYHADRRFLGLAGDLYTQAEPSFIYDFLAQHWPTDNSTLPVLTDISAALSAIYEQSHSAQSVIIYSGKNDLISLSTYTSLEPFLSSIQSDIDQVRQKIAQSSAAIKANDLSSAKLPPIYIYYAATHPRNPLSSRPYKSSFTANQNLAAFPALDHYPQYFTRVYEDGTNVIIWKVNHNGFTKLTL